MISRRIAMFLVAASMGAAAFASFVSFDGRSFFIKNPDGEKLTIEKQAGGTHTFTLELATTPAQQEQGLMYRTEMAVDHGMLFIFPQENVANFWMKNTLIPLDMIFIAPDGTIKKIHENAIPKSLETISSDVPVVATLEINGGRAKALGISVGDRVKYRVFTKKP